MHKRPKPSQRVTMAWECPSCGTRHLWKWKREDLEVQWGIYMECDKCKAFTRMSLTRIGRNAWAAAW